MRKLTTALLPVALLATSFATHAATSDGKTIGVSAGWMHIMPQGEKQGVAGSLNLGSKISTSDPDAGFEIDDADTGAILFDYYVNDNVSLEFVGGYPPKMKIDGKGTILKSISLGNNTLAGPSVNLGNIGEVGDVDAYTPALLAKYQFGTVNSKFRPFVGAGIMYAHFSNFKINGSVNPALNASMTSYLGTPSGQAVSGYLALTNPQVAKAIAAAGGNFGLAVSKVDIDDAVAPIATIGADYNFNKDWFATASVSYAHLQTTAKLDITSSTLGGAKVVSGQSEIEINPIVTYVGIGYRF